MEATQTEATRRFTVTEQYGNGDRPLTDDEMTEFVSDLADHLIDDERPIDPFVLGTVSEGAVEVVFGFSRPVSDRDTSGVISDTIHDAGTALGYVRRNMSHPCCGLLRSTYERQAGRKP